MPLFKRGLRTQLHPLDHVRINTKDRTIAFVRNYGPLTHRRLTETVEERRDFYTMNFADIAELVADAAGFVPGEPVVSGDIIDFVLLKDPLAPKKNGERP